MSHHTVVTWEKGVVRVAVVNLVQGAAELLGVAATPLHSVGSSSQPDPDRWFSACERALTQAEDMTPRWAGRKVVPDHVSMAIPSAVTRCVSVMDEVQRPNPRKPIAADELTALIRRGYRKAQDRLDVRSRGSHEDIVCGALANITLDGMPVTSPQGLTGDHLRLNLFFSLARTEWIRTLEIISHRLGLEIVTLVPHHVALAAPISDPTALLLVVDDQQTVLDMVRQGRVEWTAAIPQGSDGLIAEAVARLSLPERQIEGLLRAYRAGELRDDVETMIAHDYWAALCRWMSALAEQTRKSDHPTHLPYQIYCHDAAGRVPEIAPCLETPFWERQLQLERCPKVESLEANGSHGVLDCTTQAAGTTHLLLRSLAYYVARLYAPSNDLDRAMVDTIHWRHKA